MEEHRTMRIPENLTIATWNTERPYTKHGQRIAAAFIGGHIYFLDVDRGIDGSCLASPYPIGVSVRVMGAYDRGDYQQGIDRELREKLRAHAYDHAPKLEQRGGENDD